MAGEEVLEPLTQPGWFLPSSSPKPCQQVQLTPAAPWLRSSPSGHCAVGRTPISKFCFWPCAGPADHWPPTYLLGWEVPASPGKPPSATLPGHLLLLKLVHTALWVENGHKFFLQAVNLAYVGAGNPLSPESWPSLENGTINLWRLKKILTFLPPESSGVTLNSAEETKGRSCLTRAPGSSLASSSHEPMASWAAEGKLRWESLRHRYSVPDASQWPREQMVIRILFSPKADTDNFLKSVILTHPSLCILISTRLGQALRKKSKKS